MCVETGWFWRGKRDLGLVRVMMQRGGENRERDGACLHFCSVLMVVVVARWSDGRRR